MKYRSARETTRADKSPTLSALPVYAATLPEVGGCAGTLRKIVKGIRGWVHVRRVLAKAVVSRTNGNMSYVRDMGMVFILECGIPRIVSVTGGNPCLQTPSLERSEGVTAAVPPPVTRTCP